jgi:protein-tyrosine phosphatase
MDWQLESIENCGLPSDRDFSHAGSLHSKQESASMAPVVIDLVRADDSRDVVHRAVQALAEGHLVAFPTETVYGVAASGLNESAVRQLIEFKDRPANQPLTLVVRDANEALDYAPAMSPLAQRLARRCWPGPVTLVVPTEGSDSLVKQLSSTARDAVAPNGTVGLRVPAHATILEVMRLLAGPILLTSANRRGEEAACTGKEVKEAVGDAVSLIIDDGPCRYGQASSVVQVTDNQMSMLREGVVPEKTIRRLSSLSVLIICTGNTCRSPMAEVLLRDLIAKRFGCTKEEVEQQGISIQSAGVTAMPGDQPSREAVQVMSQIGLDLSEHESQPVTEPLALYADLILAVTQRHRQAIVSQWPQFSDKVRLLCQDGTDVADPIGGPIELYRQCAQQIRNHLNHWVDELVT